MNIHPSSSSSSSSSSSTKKVSAEAKQLLETFWYRKLNDVHKTTNNDFRNQELPLARIKKIMKLDEDVKMISGEAPVLFAKAVEFFISELSLRAWINTEENNRRTLQRNDISGAVSKYDQFDFLIDIVPREEVTSTATNNKLKKATSQNNNQFIDPSTATATAITDPFGNYYVQISGQPTAAIQATTGPGGTGQSTIQFLQATGTGQAPFSIGTPIIQVPVATQNIDTGDENSSGNRNKTGPMIITPEIATAVAPNTATAVPIALSSQQYQAIIQQQQQHHHHQTTSGHHQPILLSATGPISGYATNVQTTLISSQQSPNTNSSSSNNAQIGNKPLSSSTITTTGKNIPSSRNIP